MCKLPIRTQLLFNGILCVCLALNKLSLETHTHTHATVSFYEFILSILSNALPHPKGNYHPRELNTIIVHQHKTHFIGIIHNSKKAQTDRRIAKKLREKSVSCCDLCVCCMCVTVCALDKWADHLNRIKFQFNQQQIPLGIRFSW